MESQGVLVPWGTRVQTYPYLGMSGTTGIEAAQDDRVPGDLQDSQG